MLIYCLSGVGVFLCCYWIYSQGVRSGVERGRANVALVQTHEPTPGDAAQAKTYDGYTHGEWMAILTYAIRKKRFAEAWDLVEMLEQANRTKAVQAASGELLDRQSDVIRTLGILEEETEIVLKGPHKKGEKAILYREKMTLRIYLSSNLFTDQQRADDLMREAMKTFVDLLGGHEANVHYDLMQSDIAVLKGDPFMARRFLEMHEGDAVWGELVRSKCARLRR
jgi:hypothetical protein